jgi:hypothetical protein
MASVTAAATASAVALVVQTAAAVVVAAAVAVVMADAAAGSEGFLVVLARLVDALLVVLVVDEVLAALAKWFLVELGLAWSQYLAACRFRSKAS